MLPKRIAAPPLAALALAGLLGGPAAAQEWPDLPKVPERGGCTSELEARLAFGLCPDSTFDFYATGAYREGIPRPEAVLGYPIGSWHTTYGRMERFVEALARSAPERVRVFAYGNSIEHHTMRLVAISSEANLARLDEIRASVQRLTDPRRTTAAEAEAIIAGTPIVVWINAANDGSETAAFEAAMQVAYQVAAGEDARTRALREGAVVLVNLAHNPESHERFVAWYNAFVMGDPNAIALEHDAPWGMGNDNNHYQLDLNRDALAQTQKETRAVAYELLRWRPQVFADLHGETTQYFFPPSADPVSPAYPAQVERWLEVFGRANAAAFDALGWSYYTRDVFDLFYPGYWDTYPSLQGATGMTYETDGGGAKGVRWSRDDGTILTFHQGIAGHFVTSLATIEAAVRNREARLRDFYQFFATAPQDAVVGGTRTVILLPGDDPDRLLRLGTTLLRHGIEVQRVTRGATVSATSYTDPRRAARAVPAGALVVDLAQPAGRIARTLLAREIPLPRSFTEQELTRLARNARRAEDEQEGYAFYDVTAWSLPLAHGIPALASPGAPGLPTEMLPPLTEAQAKAPGGWEGDVAFARPGGVTARAQSAYVWRPGSLGATRLVARLLDEGFNVAVSERPLVVGDSTFPVGSWIVRPGRNPAGVHERIDALARGAGVTVLAAQTAFQDVGPTGTGSEATRTLRAPRVMVLAGDGAGENAFGALWFYLERRVGQPFTPIRTRDLDADALVGYDVLIVPDGRGYAEVLGEEAVAAVRGWVERGGTLIGYGGGARFLQGQELGPRYAEAPEEGPGADTTEAIVRRIDEAAPAGAADPLPGVSAGARPDAPLAAPGAFLRARLDLTHWLTFGYGEPELPVLTRSLPLRASLDGANPALYAAGDDLVLSGFTWPDNTQRTYAGAAYLTADQVGAGRVILFADDPVFRATFDAPAQLLWNAIYLGARGR